jgi:hypothetical protein
MRSSIALSLLLLACFVEPGWSQHYSGYTPYARYPGYGYNPGNPYVGPLPPYLMGGPAYGYTYPQPWYGYCPYPQGPRSYIAPPYTYYQPTVQTHSYYSPMHYYYPLAATPRGVMPAPKDARETKTSKGTPLPGKEAPVPTAAEKADKESNPLPRSTKKNTSLWRRLIYW